MLRMLSVPNKNSKELAVVLSCRHKPWKLIIWCCWLANEPRIRTHEHSHCYAHCLVTFSLPSWFAQGSYCIDVCSGFTKRPLHSKLKFVNSCWQTWDKIWRRQWVLVFLVFVVLREKRNFKIEDLRTLGKARRSRPKNKAIVIVFVEFAR